MKLLHAKSGLVALLLLAGCSQTTPSHVMPDESIDRVETYFRKFSSTSFVRYSEKDIIELAPYKAEFSDKRSISSLVEVLNIPCMPDRAVSEERMDIYLLVRTYRGTELLETWKASQFHFHRWPEGEVCKLDRLHRDRIESVISVLRASGSGNPLQPNEEQKKQLAE